MTREEIVKAASRLDLVQENILISLIDGWRRVDENVELLCREMSRKRWGKLTAKIVLTAAGLKVTCWELTKDGKDVAQYLARERFG